MRRPLQNEKKVNFLPRYTHILQIYVFKRKKNWANARSFLPDTAKDVKQAVVLSIWRYVVAGRSVSPVSVIAIDTANVPAQRWAECGWTVRVAVAIINDVSGAVEIVVVAA